MLAGARAFERLVSRRPSRTASPPNANTSVRGIDARAFELLRRHVVQRAQDFCSVGQLFGRRGSALAASVALSSSFAMPKSSSLTPDLAIMMLRGLQVTMDDAARVRGVDAPSAI